MREIRADAVEILACHRCGPRLLQTTTASVKRIADKGAILIGVESLGIWQCAYTLLKAGQILL